MEAPGIWRKLRAICVGSRNLAQGPQAGPLAKKRNRGPDPRPRLHGEIREGDGQKSYKLHDQWRCVPLWCCENDSVSAHLAQRYTQLSAKESQQEFRRVESLLCPCDQR